MNEEEMFHQALALSLPEERAAYLERACAGDRALRKSIEALLQANDGASGFLCGPAPGLTRGDDQPAREAPGTVMGPYKLLEAIGEGGMGVVYMAEQTQPVRRKVALQVIKPGMDTRQVVARFEAERQALALMDHPNIASILDAGTTESARPYFVMELVRGIPITEYCDRNRISIGDRLDLFVLVCQAVGHAHQKGIIHRDLKPSNVMITLHAGTPVPKVIDFGIAKATGQQTLTDKTLYTGFAELIGTPMYLSPEQAELSGIDVDTRSDIYSLGVLLYELLTGTTPFDQATFRNAGLDEVRRIIREEEPPPPSTRLGKHAPKSRSGLPTSSLIPHPSSLLLHPSSFQELDWIVMKALEKDRRRRYQTAGAFGADIARYRKHQPVEAGPPSAWYRGRKFARRHRLGLAMATIVVLSSLVVLTAWAWSVRRLDQAGRALARSRDEIQRRAIEARHHRYVADMRQAHELVQNGEAPTVLELLNKWRPAPGEPDVRNFAWHYLLRLCHDERLTLRGHKGAVYHAEFSRDGRTLVTCGQDGTVRFWEIATGQALGTIHAHDTEVNSAAFSPDGQTLATAGDDGQVRLWDVRTGERRCTIHAHEGDAGVRFSHDGGTLISGGTKDQWIKLWDVGTHKLLNSKKAGQRGIYHVALSPDGRTLVTADGDDYARLWNFPDLNLRKSLHVQHAVYGLAFSADGTRLVTTDAGGRVRMWDLLSGKPRGEFQGIAHRSDVQAVAFLAGDKMLVSADGRGIMRLCDATTGNSLATLNGHTAKIWGISVSPDGTTFATVSSDGTVKLWDARLPQRWLAIQVAPGWGPLGFAPDGHTLIVADLARGKPYVPPDGAPAYMVGGNLELTGFDPKTGAKRFHRLRVLDSREELYAYAGALSADGANAFFDARDGTANGWQVASGERLATVPCLGSPSLAAAGYAGAYSQGGSIELVDVVHGRRHTLKGTEGTEYVALSPSAQIVAMRSQEALAIWDLTTDQVRRIRRGVRPARGTAAFSPDATILAIGGIDSRGAIQLWDVSTLELLDSLPGHSAATGDLRFSSDGRVLASLAGDSPHGVVKLWDVTARTELLTLRGPLRPSALCFAPEGRTLAVRAFALDGKGSIYVIPAPLPEGLAPEEGP